MAGVTTMAITRTWIGGGNNKASNPNDWSPTGVPQPGDILQEMSGQTPLTMNVSGNDLAGDTLDLSLANSAPLTMNMSDKAVADVSVSIGDDGGTYNLTQRSMLNTTVMGSSSQVVNISGSDRFSTTGDEDMLKVNVASSSTWTGSFFLGEDTTLTASGESHSVFINDGTSELSRASAVLDLPVLGKGSFFLANTHGFLTFGSSVGAGQSVSIPGDPLSEVVIDQPNKFRGSITLGDGSSPTGESIDLMGLATADSYTFKNDMLSIFAGNTVIDTLRLTNATPYGFAVEKESGSVNIVSISNPTNPPVGLPIHI
jgi:hypothetical protein